MTDAPGDYDQVNVDIQGVEIHSDQNGWVSLPANKGVYNLLDFTNGLDTLLASGTVETGTISQIRLVLGSNNSVMVDGKLYPLSTPSAQQSGLKLNIHAVLTKGITYTILLDFDADKSIVHTGKDTYILKPVIRTVAKALDGAIKGVVNPTAAFPSVMAVSGTDTFGTYADSATGAYLVQGVKAGTYKVMFFPKSPYADTVINNVSVTTGMVTDMGTITIK